MRTVAIIQQRMGSTRLPGKALLPLAGKSMTQNIVERVKRAKMVDEVVLAIPERDMETFIDEGIACQIVAPWRDDNDLIGRYLIAAQNSEADLVVRISGDNPMVEPEYIDELINLALLDTQLVLNSEDPEGDHDGFGGELYPMPM